MIMGETKLQLQFRHHHHRTFRWMAKSQSDYVRWAGHFGPSPVSRCKSQSSIKPPIPPSKQPSVTLDSSEIMAAEAGSSISPSSLSLPLDGRVAIITGGSRGIGRAISVHLHSLGAKVVINYASNSTEANQLVSDLNAASHSQRAVAVQADVSDPLQVKLLFDRAEQELESPVHILVNSAGVMDSKYPSLANTTVEDWDKTFTVNSRGAFLCCKEGANRVKRGGGGRIIMISTSIVGSLPPGYGAYAASKAAVEAMVKIAAKELKGTKITANCVAPGPVATDFFFQGKTEEMVRRMVDGCPMERLGEPPDVAAVVGFLAGDGGEWVNGQVIRVNGGFVV